MDGAIIKTRAWSYFTDAKIRRGPTVLEDSSSIRIDRDAIPYILFRKIYKYLNVKITETIVHR